MRYSQDINGNGDEFFKHACEYDIEGTVSKLVNSHCESTRILNWLKVMCAKQKAFVVAGYTPSSKGVPNSFARLGCLRERKARLRGTGFTFKQRSDLKAAR